MKKELKTIISLLLLGAFLFPACPNDQKTMDNTKCPIDLEQEHKPSRSGTATEVSAHIDGDMITVETTDHAGSPILVEIFDDHGALRAFAGSACNSYNYNCKEIPGCGTFWKYTCDGICKAPTA